MAKLSTLRAPWWAGGCFVAALLGSVVLGNPALWAQSPARGPASPAPLGGAVAAPVSESPLEIQYVRDADGKLVRIPNMTLPEFERLFRIARNLAQPEVVPRYYLNRCELTGEVKGDRAELRAQIAITLNAPGGEWVRVPLRLAGAVLRDAPPPVVENAAESFFTIGADGGLSLFAKAKPPKSDKPAKDDIQVRLALSHPVAGAGVERKLSLAAPRANHFSLQLQISNGRILAESSAGLVDVKSLSDQRSEISVLGSGDDLQLTWRDQNQETGRVLLATASTLVTIDSPQRVSFDTRIRLQGAPGQVLDKLRVRLPPGVEYVPDPLAPFSWSSNVSGKVRTLELALNRPTSGSVDLRLQGRLTGPPERNLELGGFEVLGAAQTGHIAIALEGDWSLRWQEGKHIAQVDELPEVLRSPAVRAGFRYFRGDFSLPVSVLPKRMHLSIEPVYAVSIEPEQARLEATLNCQVRGAKAFFVDLKLDGWQVESVEPESLVDTESMILEEVAPLHVKLLRGMTGEFEIKVRARRTLADAERRLTLPLPQAQATVVHPALVLISPSESVQLTPATTDMVGLTPDASPAPGGTAAAQVLVYRSRSDEPAVFAADLRPLGRSVQIAGESLVQIGDAAATIDERLTYHVQYEPLAEIAWRVPKSLAASDRLQVRLDDEPLAPVFAEAAELGPDQQEHVIARFALPQPRQGVFVVQARYRVPLEQEAGQAATVQRLPLAAPLEGTVTGRRARLVAEGGKRVQAVAGAWLPARPIAASGGGAEPLEYTTDGPAEQLPIELLATAASRPAAPRLERVWLQTVVTNDARQDRAVFRVHLPRSPLRIMLPPGVQAAAADVLVKGKRPAPWQVVGERELSIELPPDELNRTLAVELWYPFAEPRTPRAPVELALPQVVGAPWLPQFYWQLFTPSSEIVINEPPELVSEFQWAWRGIGWAPVARLDQTELESWCSASAQPEPPSEMNVYLLSGLGTVEGVRVEMGDRRFWLLAAAGVILLVGLMFVYVPEVRHPGFVAALALIVGGAALYYGNVATIVAQGAAAGLTLALLAFLLATLVRPREERPAAPVSAGDSRSSEPRPADSRPGDSRPREIRTTESAPGYVRGSSQQTPALPTAAFLPTPGSTEGVK